jgi:hypothetical protein
MKTLDLGGMSWNFLIFRHAACIHSHLAVVTGRHTGPRERLGVAAGSEVIFPSNPDATAVTQRHTQDDVGVPQNGLCLKKNAKKSRWICWFILILIVKIGHKLGVCQKNDTHPNEPES